MKITSVEIHSETSTDYAVLTFQDLNRVNPYNVKAITGLDSDEVVSQYYSAWTPTTTPKFYNLAQNKRTIVMQISLNPNFSQNQSYSDLRDALYKKIAMSRTGKVQLQFKSASTIVAVISGFVKKFETTHFDRDPDVQITITCDDSMFKSPTRISYPTASLTNTSNLSIPDNVSTAPHGFIFQLVVQTSPFYTLKITDPGDASWAFEFSYPGGAQFLVGDVINFSSEYGSKDLYVTRSAVKTSLIGRITLGSAWPIIFPGVNRFSFTNPTLILFQDWEWYSTYWGV